ncbi:MAG: DUF1080 domain-containing protein [Pirellulales bacterium]
MLVRYCFLALAMSLLFQTCIVAEPTEHPAYTDPQKTDEDFIFQGEYTGDMLTEGQSMPVGVQVIALGDGSFDAVGYPGGLPGAGWNPPDKVMAKGSRENGQQGAIVKFTGKDWDNTVKTAEILVIDGQPILNVFDDGNRTAILKKVNRKSSTLGLQAPPDAIVLFDGTNTDSFLNGRMTDDGLLMEGVTTKDSFGSARWHIEFCLPYQPRSRGQGRGNSGAYFHGSYETQMLDSFGLEGKDNECGGIYKVAAPLVNMCLPPLSWQTYDVDVTAPQFEDGKKIAHAKLTVRHNGVLIHDEVEIPKITQGGPQKKEAATGPLHLQNHGNPVRYRNIWVLPKS